MQYYAKVKFKNFFRYISLSGNFFDRLFEVKGFTHIDQSETKMETLSNVRTEIDEERGALISTSDFRLEIRVV